MKKKAECGVHIDVSAITENGWLPWKKGVYSLKFLTDNFVPLDSEYIGPMKALTLSFILLVVGEISHAVIIKLANRDNKQYAIYH